MEFSIKDYKNLNLENWEVIVPNGLVKKQENELHASVNGNCICVEFPKGTDKGAVKTLLQVDWSLSQIEEFVAEEIKVLEWLRENMTVIRFSPVMIKEKRGRSANLNPEFLIKVDDKKIIVKNQKIYRGNGKGDHFLAELGAEGLKSALGKDVSEEMFFSVGRQKTNELLTSEKLTKISYSDFKTTFRFEGTVAGEYPLVFCFCGDENGFCCWEDRDGSRFDIGKETLQKFRVETEKELFWALRARAENVRKEEVDLLEKILSALPAGIAVLALNE